MTRRRAVIAATVLVLAAAGCAGTWPAPLVPEQNALDRPTVRHLMGAVPGRRVVIGARDTAHAARAIARCRGRSAAAVPGLGAHVVDIPEGAAMESTLADLRALPGVAYAEVDALAYATDYTPNDPRLAEQWGLKTMHAPAAWQVTRGKAGVIVAVLDSGVDVGHPDLAYKVIDSRNFTTSTTTQDRHGHGTHVAGIVAAATDNRTGIAGSGFATRVLGLKVLGDDGVGYYSWLATGIVYAADRGVRVMTMSLGGGTPSQVLADALAYAAKKGVVVIAAAGNSGTTAPFYPAFYTSCIAVAATDATDRLAGFSNRGTWVDVAAPGVGILSTLPRGANRMGATSMGLASGTSMAAPYVAGEAALLAARGLGAAAIRSRIESTTTRLAGTDGTAIARGRIDMGRALGP